MPDESGEPRGESLVLEYSERTRTWALHSPSDYRRAWREQSLHDLAETAIGMSLMYRYDIDGHDSTRFQPHAHSFEGVLLAVAGHPRAFSIPERLRGDYSRQQLEFVEAWQRLLVDGFGDGAMPPIDPQSLSFGDALRLMDEAGRFDEQVADDVSAAEVAGERLVAAEEEDDGDSTGAPAASHVADDDEEGDR